LNKTLEDTDNLQKNQTASKSQNESNRLNGSKASKRSEVSNGANGQNESEIQSENKVQKGSEIQNETKDPTVSENQNKIKGQNKSEIAAQNKTEIAAQNKTELLNESGNHIGLWAKTRSKQSDLLDLLSADSGVSSIRKQLLSGRDPDQIIAYLSDQLESTGGVEFLSSFKHLMLALSNGDLNNIKLDNEGLEALKKILTNAGFNASEIDELITDLKSEMETKMLGLDDLMDHLFNLELSEEDEAQTDNTILMEPSTLPFIESLLISLGVPSEEINKMLTEAVKGNEGISLDTLIEQLQVLQKKSYASGQGFVTKEGDQNHIHLIDQLGLNMDRANSAPLSLNEFVAALESLRSQKSQIMSKNSVDSKNITPTESSRIESAEDALKALFKGMKIKEDPSEKPVVRFSKNSGQSPVDLLADKEGKPSVLFADPKEVSLKSKSAKDNISKEQLLKETTIADKSMDSKPSSTSAKDQIDPKALVKAVESKASTSSEQTPVAVSDNRSNEAATNLSLLKSKASFKNLPTYVTNQVGKSIVRAVNLGEDVLRIQLKPPELGRLMMTIDKSGDTLKVSIMTENYAAKDILTTNVNELRTVLSNSGVNLEKFDVDMNSDFRQSMADAEQFSGRFGKRNRQKNGGQMTEDSQLIRENQDSVEASADMEGSLHYVA
jgi:flagellar hook-length control protein FliK